MRRITLVLIAAAIAFAGCGDDDDESETTALAPESATTTAAEEASPLEGTWRTKPVTVAEMADTVREARLGKLVDDFEKNAPISDAPTVLILDVGDDWDLYGQGQGEPRKKIDFDALFEVSGNTVVVTHSTGASNTFRWSVRDDVLELTWLKGDAPPFKGIPDETYQRALYMTAEFQRAS